MCDTLSKRTWVAAVQRRHYVGDMAKLSSIGDTNSCDVNMKSYFLSTSWRYRREVELQLHSFLTSALVGSE